MIDTFAADIPARRRLTGVVESLGGAPVIAFVAGISLAIAAAGVEWIGIGTEGFGRQQWFALVAGVALAAVGVVADAATAERRLAIWFEQVIEGTRGLARTAVVLVELLLLVAVIAQFHFENQVFYEKIMALVVVGFVVHQMLPRPLRAGFFVMLSASALLIVLGTRNGAAVIGVVLALVAVCHLPIAYWLRVVLVAIAGATLAAMRAGRTWSPFAASIWPVLGSIVMFRLILYLYEVRHRKGTVPLGRRLAYFFLLPNVVFPFFPVVDFDTLQRTYYGRDAHTIHQKGIRWILRGVLHLIAYRVVNHYMVIAPEQVATFTDLARFLTSNFLLYLRISGQFHLVVGILHLFGFDLPETHIRYYLANSFTDLWRRINVYWKDFMQKMFFYPVYFRARRLGNGLGLTIATIVVFVMTWFLHAYAWFWFRGTFLITATDIAFWGSLAVIVLINTAYDLGHQRRRSLSGQGRSARELAWRTARTLATFTIMCLLWALWTSDSFADWLGLFRGVAIAPRDLVIIPAALIALAGAIAFSTLRDWRREAVALGKQREPAFSASAVASIATMAVLWLATNPQAYGRLEGRAPQILADLRMERLSTRDAALMQRGYYEELTNVNRFNSGLWQLYMRRPDTWVSLEQTDAVRHTGDFLGYEHLPHAATIFRGSSYRTNRWGMRDRDYELVPPAGAFRITLMGSSHTAGSGVGDADVFDNIVEDRLNALPADSRRFAYEILNFAVDGYSTLQQIPALEKVKRFSPHAILYAAHPGQETDRTIDVLILRIREGAAMPSPCVDRLVAESGVTAEMPETAMRKALLPLADRLLSCAYAAIGRYAASRNLPLLMTLTPRAPGDHDPENARTLAQLGRTHGFRVIDMMGMYDGHDARALKVAPWDYHPNARAHAIIADTLFQALVDLGISHGLSGT